MALALLISCLVALLSIVQVAAQSCEPGYYCPPGSAPILCEWGFFCPAGSTNHTPCNYATLLDTEPNVTIPSSSSSPQSAAINVYFMGTPLAGNYCPPGSISPTLMCPSGHYCPNVSSVPILCPENYYCKVGTVDPRPCSTVAKCQVGSSAPGIYVNAIVGVVILLFVLWILYLLIYVAIMAQRRRIARQRENRERVAILVQPLLNPNAQYNAKVAHLKLFRNIQPLISIKFTQLGLTLKDGSSILSGVTGEFQHSKLYAVMGPSGAGKSTFFNALTGSASSYGSIKGTVEINGKEANLNQYKDVLGFVPQDDTVHEDLTVMENLLSSVKIRSARGTTAKECKAMVDAVIDLLGMSHISQSIVGSVEHRGISGGQRKRVNIGTELVAKPSVCFMDEPTSGLDSSATLDVLGALKSLAGCGMNISCVIHQPRYSVFVLFDELLLLGKGGVTAFMGPTEQMLVYFNRIGFEIAANENPADFMLDVCSGSMERRGDPHFKPSDLTKLWVEEGIDFVRSHQPEAAIFSLERKSRLNSAVGTLPATLQAIDEALEDCGFFLEEGEHASDVQLDLQSMQAFLFQMTGTEMTEKDIEQVMGHIKPGSKVITGEDIKSYVISNHEHAPRLPAPTQDPEGVTVDVNQGEGATLDKSGPVRIKASPFRVFLTLFRRAIAKKLRLWVNMVTAVFLILFTSLITGAMTSSSYLAAAWTAQSLQVQLILALIMVVCSMGVLGQDRVVLIRETKTGTPTILVYLSLIIVHLLDIFILPLIFCLIFYTFVSPEIPIRYYYMVLLLTAWYASGLAYIGSALFSPTNALVATIAFVLVFDSFINGVVAPSYADNSGSALRYLTGMGKFLAGISSTRWGVEIVAAMEFIQYPSYQQPQVHAYLAQIGLCGTTGYLTPYDLRTWPAEINSTLPTLTLSDLNTSNQCSATGKIIVLDYLAMLLQGFIWRILAYWALWMKLRPEAPGLYTLMKRGAEIFIGWFQSEVKSENAATQRHVRDVYSTSQVVPEPHVQSPEHASSPPPQSQYEPSPAPSTPPVARNPFGIES